MTTRSAGEPSAELLSWDSEFWGVRIAKAPTLMDDWALENTIGCMWMLIPASEQAEVHRAEQGGARVMDVRVKLDAEPMIYTSMATRPIRHATKDDEEALVAIARTAFRGLTRFYADPRFPDERCDDLYENWVRDSLNGWAATTLILQYPDRGPGFITVHLNPTPWGTQDASIGLIAVAEDARGLSMGYHLTGAAMAWAAERRAEKISVVTQACNIPALRVFQANGFRTCQTDVWLHKWFYDA